MVWEVTVRLGIPHTTVPSHVMSSRIHPHLCSHIHVYTSPTPQGPQRREAAEAFALNVADSLEGMHKSAKMQYVVHTLELCWDPAEAARKAGAAYAAGSRPGSAAPGSRPGSAAGGGGMRGGGGGMAAGGAGGRPGGGRGLVFNMADWADPLRKKAMMDALISVARNTTQVRDEVVVRSR